MIKTRYQPRATTRRRGSGWAIPALLLAVLLNPVFTPNGMSAQAAETSSLPIQKASPLPPSAPKTAGPTGLETWPSWFTSDVLGNGAPAWGDVDADGDLDLALGGSLYSNDGGALSTVAAWHVEPGGNAAWGDMNGDGDLDLAVGGRVYLNDGGMLQDTPAWTCPFNTVTDMAWGDMNGDGYFDLAVANNGSQPNMVFTNVNGLLATTPAWQDTSSIATTSVAWGDMDADGDLDLALGFYGASTRVYCTVDGMLESAPCFTDPWWATYTTDLAWGDWNNDGYPELAGTMFIVDSPIWVYINQGGEFVDIWLSDYAGLGRSVAWGDVNGDGYLDLAAAFSTDQPEKVYLNRDGALLPDPAWTSSSLNNTSGIAWGDVDGDGDLDLAASTYGVRGLLYRNEGARLLANADWTSADAARTYSVAWGDMDGDGDLDLAAGNMGSPNVVYENQGTALVQLPVWSDTVDRQTRSVAWGDMDGDGDLDLAAGNWGQPNVVYLNVGGTPSTTLGWTDNVTDTTTSIAWGDMDGDGDLDLAVGNWDQPNKVYLNLEGELSSTPVWQSIDTPHTNGVAWGDVDGDGDLDLAISGWGRPISLYLNVAGTLQPSPAWTSIPTDPVTAIAWGDMNGDGRLDLAASGSYVQTKVYLNEAGMLQRTPGWTSLDAGAAHSVAWGDADGDGDLDLAVGNGGGYYGGTAGPSRLYLNQGGMLQRESVWLPEDIGTDTETHSVAWGDIDGDGDLDLAFGNEDSGSPWCYCPEPRENAIYMNRLLPAYSLRPSRLAASTSLWPLSEPVSTFSGGTSTALAPADFYAIPGIRGDGTIPISYTLFYPTGEAVRQVRAAYSPDGGGHWFPALATSDTITTNLSTSICTTTLVPIFSEGFEGGVLPPPGWSLYRTGAPDDPGWQIGTIGALDFDDEPRGGVYFAWHDDDNTTGTAISWLVTPYITVPDSGQVVFWQHSRWQAYYNYHGVMVTTGADPNPSVSLYTEIWSRGTGETWIRQTVDLSAYAGQQIHLAFVYIGDWADEWYLDDIAINASETSCSTGGAHLFTWDTFRSGFLGQSDDVVLRFEALPSTGPVANGIPGPYQRPYAAAQTFPFRVRGTQIRVLSDTLPAAGATGYRIPAGQFQGFPIADGAGQPYQTDRSGYLQGRGELYQGDRLVALLPISTTNAYTLLYSSAIPTLTGLVAYTVTAPGVQTLTVSPDNPLLLLDLDVSLQWDARNDQRFMGELTYNLQRTSDLLFDWSNGQAALGHVTIYHDRDHWYDADVRVYATNHLRPNATQGGISPNLISDTLVPTVTYAPGQVSMGAVWNRYGDPGGNLGDDWPRTLAHELAHYAFFLDDNYLGLDSNGLLIPVSGCPGAMSDPYREDYPYDEFHPAQDWLPACEQTLSHQGTGRSDWETLTTFYPALSPYAAVTNPGPATLPLSVTTIRIVEPITPPTTLIDPTFYLFQDGHSVQPGPDARVILFQGDWATDLGHPVLDHVVARGARVDDRLCLYEPTAGRLGCETISALDRELALVALPDWDPDVIISPITSRTIVLTVTNVPQGLPLNARLFPLNAAATAPMALSWTPAGYAGILPSSAPAMAGLVQVWVDEPAPRREIVSDYNLGGSPGFMSGDRAPTRGHLSPAVSADGQVVLFGQIDFQGDEFYALQPATHLPSPLPWATLIGHPYRLLASPGAPGLAQSSISISFSYTSDEVFPGEEEWLRLYFWDGTNWHILPTSLDTDHNYASAPAQGEGLYALMSSIEIPLAQGWNLVAYPVPQTRPVTETLLSISGTYGLVYNYLATDPADPWKVYGVGAPDWVNDLDSFYFDRGYWISTTQAITLYLKGASGGGLETGFPSPPATYYGQVLGNAFFTPTAGMTVTAWIEGTLCGQAHTLEVGGLVVYAISVVADDGSPGTAGCGVVGRPTTFQVAGQSMAPVSLWNSGRLWSLSLYPGSPTTLHRIYLPIVTRAP